MSAVTKARNDARAAACQDNLRNLHTGRSGAASLDPLGRYPQVGVSGVPTTAASATTWLIDRGQLPPGYKPGCPATTDRVAYTYTLGFRGGDGVRVGLTRPRERSDDDTADQMPLSADLPAVEAAPGPARCPRTAAP